MPKPDRTTTDRTEPARTSSRRRVDRTTDLVPPDREPDFVTVKVRPDHRGEYGWCIRNAGEVFEMDTKVMRGWPLASGERRNPDYNENEVLVQTPLGSFEVPPWVDLVDPDAIDDDERVPKGHKTSHGVLGGTPL